MSFREESHNRLLLYLETLDRREKGEFIRLAVAWQDISSELESLISKLSKLEKLSENQLFHLELYKTFLRDSREIITTYNQVADGIITNEQEVFAKLGIQSAQDLIGIVQGFFCKLSHTFPCYVS